MSYVRIDDGAMSHPKILSLSDKAFRLWVWGLCYAQMHLTDGYIPLVALPSRLKAAVPALMAPNPILWEVSSRTDGGFQVHDYADWNDVKAVVEKNRAAARDRMQKRRASDPVPSDRSRENTPSVRPRTFAQNVPVRKYVSSESSEEKEKIADRAAVLREELYPAWYAKYRHGAKLRLVANSLEFQDAITLCETWDDTRLEQLAQIVLTTDDDWISRTDRSFKIFAAKASWADDRLTQAEKAAV